MLSLPEGNRQTNLMMIAQLGFLLNALTATAQEVSVSCMMAYDEGGAPAVFESPECTQWVLPPRILNNQAKNCQFASVQGHRDYQEDRVTCNLDFKIPVLGSKDGLKEIVVGVLAVFDGHGGKEASEMASNYLLDYFLLHVIFCTYKQSMLSEDKGKLAQGKNKAKKVNFTLESSQGGLPINDDIPVYKILKEALLGAIHDIDIKFSLEAINNNYVSGSTATVVLLLDGKILVANVGDSKALLCSYDDHPGTKLSAKELTRDHHPSRDDEKARIKAAGGFVRVWGVPRVNGILAVSRSIGDISLKRYGIIAIPEVTDWESLKSKDRYLVVASDGIFESMTSQNVCELLEETEASENISLSSLWSLLAGRVVNYALRKGSMDNLSAIVVPLAGSRKSQECAADL
ncbi:Protein-serine/threonine phosphatase [Heracleum sosnowskyi]|uniref:protein-serine/threonine phosphatase n=1 Tax=Heracleum sosnowskyi TaxID=360622 RepID=A0AAD8HVF0_9APIA|nr:Protein-serine/threonine phosphatase [Heracleum sosnowskyi]